MVFEIFALGLIVQALFRTTPVTFGAVLPIFLVATVFYFVTGEKYFEDSNIPLLVFLGASFFVTDPATSPKTLGAKLLFGALYGGGVLLLFQIFRRYSLPTFYEKLLFVPILNLGINAMDRAVLWLRPNLPASFCDAISAPTNRLLMTYWVTLFALMCLIKFVP